MPEIKGHPHSQHCPECDIGPFTRNHYWDGKLLVKRDFVDEQRYYVDKLRHHQQRLHGWGVVCGLRVKEHENPACRDRLVCVEPGSAVDCCGHDVIVHEEDCIDLTQFDAFRRLIEAAEEADDPEAEPEAHTLQLCIRYRECPTEEIPVLFDECGCDDSRCAPNRILESYEFDLLIDPEPHAAADPAGIRMEWEHTLPLARAHRVAYEPNQGIVYALSRDEAAGTGSLIAFSAENHSILHADTISGTVMDMAVATDGSHVFVSLLAETSGGPRLRIRVYQPDLTSFSVLTLPNAGSADVRLAVAPDQRLYALHVSEASVYAWDDPESDPASERVGPIAVGAAPWGITVTPDGSRVFVANSGGASLSVIDAADLTAAPVTVDVAGSVPYSLAVAETTAGVRLFVADRNDALHVFSVEPSAADPYTLLGSASLPETPVDLIASSGGRWLFVLLEDGDGRGHVQVIDAHRVEAGEAQALGGSVEVGEAPRDLARGADIQRLYAAYAGNDVDEATGGVAVLAVTEVACESILEGLIDGCPDCDESNCLVLATITDYVPGEDITNADIDNLTDRRLLPSTSVLARVIRCLLDHEGGAGAPGEQGPPGDDGEDGEDGLGIDDVSVSFVDCSEPGAAAIEDVGGVRTLMLEIPRGCDGEDGEDGADGADGLGIDDVTITFVPCEEGGSAQIVETEEGRILVLQIPGNCNPDLAHICAISWEHAGTLSRGEFLERGLIIAFDRDVRNGDLHRHSVRVLRERREDDTGATCWCEVQPEVMCGIRIDPACRIPPDFAPDCMEEPDAPVNGVRFLPDRRSIIGADEFRVLVQGDFIREVNADGEPGRALDGDHLPPWVPRRRSGDGVEGGTFESWFRLE